MTSASVSLVLGPADWLECDARLVPVASSKLAPQAAAALSGALRQRARDAAHAMFVSAAGQLSVALPADDSRTPLAVLVRIPGLGSTGRDLQQRVDAGFDAALAAMNDELASERPRSHGPLRLLVPCPSTLGWFRPSALHEGARAVLNAARRTARGRQIDVVIAVEDRSLMRFLQSERTCDAQRWWEILDRDSFDVLAGAAQTVAENSAAVLVGSGGTGRDVYDGFDSRIRAVADRFGLSTVVPKGVGEGRHVLEALIVKSDEDSTGARWDRLVRELRREFEDEVLGVGVSLVASLPTSWLGSLAPDGRVGAASDGIQEGPRVTDLMGTYRDPVSMSPTASAGVGLPRLAELLTQVPAHPDLCVFIGVERDPQTFAELLEAMVRAVPGFDASEKLLLQHTDVWMSDKKSRWASQFASVVITEDGTRTERARAFEQILDAFVALAWTRGKGHFKERAAPEPTIVLRRAESSSSVWAFNGGLPG
ncbi:MAG: hypothetical protein ACQEWM_03735 [Actinomycetota bacterium]